MSKRVSAILVILEDDINEEGFMKYEDFIKAIRGVKDVAPFFKQTCCDVEAIRAQNKVREKLFELSKTFEIKGD